MLKVDLPVVFHLHLWQRKASPTSQVPNKDLERGSGTGDAATHEETRETKVSSELYETRMRGNSQI